MNPLCGALRAVLQGCMTETLYFNKRANLCVGALEPIKLSYNMTDKTILQMYNVKTWRHQSFIEGDLPLDVYINNLHCCDSL